MIPSKRDSSSSVFSDDFTVHMGPSHVADWPLGQSATHDHYIKPVPPFYVTEYEANYTWPSRQQSPSSKNAISSVSKELEQEKDDGIHEEKNEMKMNFETGNRQEPLSTYTGEKVRIDALTD